MQIRWPDDETRSSEEDALAYHYYLLGCPVRVDDETLEAVVLTRDGRYMEEDAYRAVCEGKELTEVARGIAPGGIGRD